MKKFPPPFLPMFHCLCIGWSTLFYWKSYQVRTYMYATCEYAVTDWWFNPCETSTPPPPHPSGYPGIWNLNFLRLACPNSKLCSNAPPNFFVKGKISNYDFLDIDQDLKPSLFQSNYPPQPGRVQILHLWTHMQMTVKNRWVAWGGGGCWNFELIGWLQRL